MCSAIAIHLVLLAIGASAGNDLFDGLAFDHVGELMVEANDYRDIGWVQFGSCAEGDNSLQYPSGYTFEQLLELARYAVTVKFMPSSKLPTDAFSNSDDFTVYTELCSNPVYAFNHGYEMSFFLDIPSSTVSAQASTSEWIGTSTAKSRLANSCNDGEATPIADGDVYHACGNGAGIHITQQGCWWSLNDYLGEDITIWMGFDASKAAYCDFDDYGEYQLFPYPETSIPAADSCLEYTFGFKTNNGADNFPASGGVHTITLFLDRNTMLQCEIAPSLTDTWYLCTAEGTGSNEAAYTRCEVDQEISPSVSQPVMQISNPTSGDNSEAIQVQLSITNTVTGATQFETLGALAPAEVIGPNGLRYRQYFFTNNDGGQQSIEGVAPVAGDFVPVCSTASEEAAYTPSPGESSLTFGIKTCSEHYGSASEEVKLSLYWHAKMYQCSVTPNQRGQWFSCEYSSADNDIECDAHNRVLDYALQVSTVNALSNDMDDSCIAEIYVREVVDGETVNEVELMVANAEAQWIGDTYSNSVSDSTNALYGPISTTASETCGVVGVHSRGEYDFCFHYEAVSVTIMACDGFTASAATTEESVKMQLFGEGGTSRFLYVNSGEQTVLPENGETLTYDIDASVSDDLGELYRVKLSLDDTTAYCLQSLSVHVQNKSYHFSASEYFGSGVFLSSECSTTFMALPSSSSSEEYIRCFDDYVTLNTYEARSVLEMTAHSCIGDASGASLSTLADSVSAAVVGKIDSSNGYVSEIVRLDTPSGWDANVDRIYHLNLESYMDEVTVISITNDNAADDLCIDEVTIDDSAAVYLSANFIGGTSSSTSTMSAIFEYPVCKTEVVGMRVDYETSTADILKGDASIVGLTCSNHNRLVSSTCSISQSYEVSSTTSFAISNENTKTSEYSWGTESSVSAGTSSSQSTTTSDEFSWGLSQEVTAEAEFEALGVSTSVSVSVGANQQWTSSTEEATESSTSTDTTNSQSSSNAAGSELSSGYESSYETTASSSVECVAEFELPPSHSIQYSLIFNAFNTTINTHTDLKLTLCSAFLDPTASANDDSNYVYIDDIPGVINHKETTSCTVQFSPMEYLRNEMSCEEERSLSLSILSDYLPSCKPDGTYDGCQRDRDGTICWCVDAEGNKLNGASMTVEDGILWQEVCVNKLQCENSDVTNDNYLSALEDDMDCATAQKLAIYKGDEYMPQCRIADSTAYDGCQCVNIGSSGRCWCVTNGGANIDGKAKEVKDSEGISGEQLCVQILQCADSDVVYTAAVEVEPPSSNVYNYNGLNPQDLYDSVKLLSVALVSVAILMVCKQYINQRHRNKVVAYDMVAADSCDEEERCLQK